MRKLFCRHHCRLLGKSVCLPRNSSGYWNSSMTRPFLLTSSEEAGCCRISVCHNLKRYANKVFKGIANDRKETMGWCHGFKLHFTCNNRIQKEGAFISSHGFKLHFTCNNRDACMILYSIRHGFKLHFTCNNRGEIIIFCLTVANVGDRNPKAWNVLTKELYGRFFADRRYISPRLFRRFSKEEST